MKKKVIIAILASSLIVFIPKAKAATFEDNAVVDAKKNWTIHFNEEVSFDDLSKQNIIVTDNSGTKVKVTLKLDDDGKGIIVEPPAEGYTEGNKYKLVVGEKVHSKKNKSIKRKIIMNFSIEKDNEVVTFKDINLEKVVRDAINKPDGTLYKKDVDKITYLNAVGKNIVYLDGIEKLTSLGTACLSKNNIKDITPLKELTNLVNLYMVDNQIQDITAVKKLVNLNSIYLQNNNIRNINALSNLINLKCLQLAGNQINNIDALGNLTKLEDVGIENNQVATIKTLKNLSNLKKLSINNNPINDISPLTNLNNLGYLSFDGNSFDINSLKQIKSLKQVYAYGLDDLNKIFQVYDKANKIIKEIIKPGMSELEKEKAIHDYIVLNTKYDYDNYLKNTMPDDDHTLYGVLINGMGVCDGYAQATKLLLNMVGIKCIVAQGQSNNNNEGWRNHAWNIVQINGEYYQLDTTWDDSLDKAEDCVRYKYFNASDKELSKDHKWDDKYYPKCTDSLGRYGVSGKKVITFKDYNLEKLVRQILNKPDGNISMDDVRSISQIIYLPKEESKKIKDLSGIENLENLTDLQLRDNSIENIEPIGKLKWLENLALSNDKAWDVGVLSSLTQLNSLIVSGNNILNLDSLGNMTKLTSLDFDNINIKDLHSLANMKNLTSLGINNTNIENVDFLRNMTNLESLYLSKDNITNIDGLSKLTKLGFLNLSNNKISDITSLSGMTSLTFLDLRNNKIENLDSLSYMTNLKVLQLSDNNISNINPLSNLAKLGNLQLDSNNITNINALSKLTKLQCLNLKNNKILDIAPLSGVTSLTWLNLGDNKIENVDSLGYMINLDNLFLSNNIIKNIDPLKNLTSLKYLDVAENPLSENAINELKKVLSNCNIYKG